MAHIRVGSTSLNITPAVGPSSGSAPTQEVTSFGSVSGELSIDLSGASVQMVVLGNSPEAAVLDELASDLWIEGDLAARYRVWSVWQDFDEHGDDRVSFQAVSYERLLSRRLVGAGGLSWNNVDVGTIIWDSIQHTQAKPGGNWGITAGSIVTGAQASPAWLPGENLGQRITELLEATNCRWWIDADLVMHVASRSDGPVMDTPIHWRANARALQRASGGVGFANSVFGSASQVTTPGFSTSPDIGTDPRGLWEVAKAWPTVDSQNGLEALRDGALDEVIQALSHWNVDLVAERWVPDSRLWVGSWGRLVVPRTLAGPIAPPPRWRAVECTQISMSFTGDGGFTVRGVVDERDPAAHSPTITPPPGV